ncbi:MAG: ATP-dependent DNA helicase [Rhodocyclaceae bacterium]|nr:ATP-dependent DNA helicase [Rhodocyclaceae bacterium]
MHNLNSLFSPEGPLARAISGYRARPQQVEMSARILEAITDNRVLIAEAGTGTGKTFAYLVPALLSGGKVIVSTGTKTLQDQLFNRDLPTVREALGVPATLALLKGRANYICPYHLARALESGRFYSKEESGHIRAIARFAKSTSSGDKAELSSVPEDSHAWSQATSTRENCLGSECPNVKGCFVLAARREAMGADVIVVNHHLFFADVMLRDDGMGELLPTCNTVIFDEAHQLPEVAGLFFGESVGTARILDLAHDTKLEAIANAKDYTPLQDACRVLEKAAKDLRLSFSREGLRISEAQWRDHDEAQRMLVVLEGQLAEFTRHLESQSGRSEGLENCHLRAQEITAGLKRWQIGSHATATEEGESYVHWVEVTAYAVTLNLTPLSVASLFQRQMADHPRAWIFTSATLAVGDDFGHYQSALGLVEAETGLWGSPFDFGHCSLLYCPPNMPDPNSAFYLEAVAEAAWPVLQASRGRAFMLCTSLRAMRRIHELFKEKIEAMEDAPYALLLQGESSKSELLDRFRQLGNAILVASVSFWEGVDVRGEALSLVIIDKLPFAPPDDPVLSARIEHIKKQGGNPFFDYQLPRTVISMKQGAGRLIRDETDRGVLMICDPRLVGKPYGRRIWQSLPPMRRTREIREVEEFFR